MTGTVELSPIQVALVRDSYAEVRRLDQNYSSLFYHRLLERHPFTRALFPDDLTRQISVFRLTIDALVEQLDEPGAWQTELVELGRRHVGYGVLPEHYGYVGSVLIDTFGEMLGDRFDVETRIAWETLYKRVTQAMLSS